MYDCTFKSLQKGKVCNRTDLIAYANYGHVRLCFMLVPLGGKVTWGQSSKQDLGAFQVFLSKKPTSTPVTFTWKPLPGMRSRFLELSSWFYISIQVNIRIDRPLFNSVCK